MAVSSVRSLGVDDEEIEDDFGVTTRFFVVLEESSPSPLRLLPDLDFGAKKDVIIVSTEGKALLCNLH